VQTIKRTWSGGLFGKLLIGCGGLIILSCICAVPLTIFGSLLGDSDATNKEAEYVDLQNIGDAPQDLAGWLLRSEKGNEVH